MVQYDLTNVNKYYKLKVNSRMSKIPDELDKTIDIIKNYVRGIPNKGYFRNYAKDYFNKSQTLFARGIALSVERDEENEGVARLIVAVLHPKQNIEASTMLICGNSESILKYMEEDGFKQEVVNAIYKLSDSLKDKY